MHRKYSSGKLGMKKIWGIQRSVVGTTKGQDRRHMEFVMECKVALKGCSLFFLTGVLVSLGRHNEIPDWGFNQETHISHSSGGRKSKIKVPAESLVRVSPCFIDGCLLAVSSSNGRE